MEPKGRHQRGYLPHRDYGRSLQAITFRENDSLPAKVIAEWKTELRELLESSCETTRSAAQRELRQRIARYEDAGHGLCRLRSPDLAATVQHELLAGHDGPYRLIAWCVMPNHVHVLIRQAAHSSLGQIVRSWKGRSARVINDRLGLSGRLWGPDYFDRVIRDDAHFWNAIHYIHQNPVRAGLVADPAAWPFSSLGHGWPLPKE